MDLYEQPEMREEIKKRLGDIICVAPWTKLNLFGEFKKGKQEREKGEKMLLWFKIYRHIGDEGARMISEGLKINSTLTYLNLRSERKKKRNKGKR